jgi:hypothetical protein
VSRLAVPGAAGAPGAPGALVAAALAAGCTQNVDPAWQLDHDRVIAVRATPSRIASGESAQLDALLGYQGAPPGELEPETVEVVSPTSLAGALAHGAHWTVTAPGDDRLAAARSELGLAAGAAVPLRVRVRFAGTSLTGLKVVWLGEHADNPVIDPVTIDGANALAEAQLSLPGDVDVPLAVNFDQTYNINWLTSCGTMHDFDLAHAHLHILPSDPQSGTLAIVVRDPQGGVAWHLWPVAAR